MGQAYVTCPKNWKLVIYLKPTAACQTNASNKKKTGITGNTSTKGLKIW